MGFLTLLAIGVCLVVLFFKWRYGYWRRLGIPQLEPTLFFGNFKELLLGTESVYVNLLKNYKKLIQLKSKHAGVYLGPEPFYVPLDPKLIKNILYRDFSYFYAHGIFHHPKDIISNNILSANEDEWKILRYKLAPAFSSGKIQLLFDTILEKLNTFKQVIDKYALTKEDCNATKHMSAFTIDSYSDCFFGVKCNAINEPNSRYLKECQKIFETNKFKFFLEAFVPWSILGEMGYKLLGDSNTEKFYIHLITETIKSREQDNIIKSDFLQMLIQLKNKGDLLENFDILESRIKGKNTLTEKEIIAQSCFFLIVGYIGSSTTMNFTLFNLAQHEDIQDKLRKEVHVALSKNKGKLTYHVLSEMELLDRVIKESLRLYPPLAGIPRTCTKDYILKDENTKISKGTKVLIPSWGIHLDARYYPNPERFNPDNFSPENVAKRPECTWLPFGEGKRICLGMKFALMQAKIGIAMLIKDYQFTVSPKTKFPFEYKTGAVVLGVKGDIWLNITKLNS